jgi:hypothetical protein
MLRENVYSKKSTLSGIKGKGGGIQTGPLNGILLWLG